MRKKCKFPFNKRAKKNANHHDECGDSTNIQK